MSSSHLSITSPERAHNEGELYGGITSRPHPPNSNKHDPWTNYFPRAKKGPTSTHKTKQKVCIMWRPPWERVKPPNVRRGRFPFFTTIPSFHNKLCRCIPPIYRGGNLEVRLANNIV